MRQRMVQHAGVLCAALTMLLLMASSACAAGIYYGCTVRSTPVYAASSLKKTKGKPIDAYTVLRIDEKNAAYLHASDVGYVSPRDVKLFSTERVQLETAVYYTSAQTMYATPERSHPLPRKLPAKTAVAPLRIANKHYLVQYDGVYGFVPIRGSHRPPHPKKTAAVMALLTPQMKLYTLPFANAATKERLQESIVAKLTWRYDGFYYFTARGRSYYVKSRDIISLGAAKRPQAAEGYADKIIPMLDVPSKTYGKTISAIPRDAVCALQAQYGNYVKVKYDGKTGYALARDFTYPGGNGKDKYFLFLNKSTYTLTVYKADKNGNRTNVKVLETVVAIGRITTPTPSGEFTVGAREAWHDFGHSYAPYAMAYTDGRYIHGPLYLGPKTSQIIKSRLGDFGSMNTGGCIRTPYEDVRWIYFHCGEGTKLEVVNGVRTLASE